MNKEMTKSDKLFYGTLGGLGAGTTGLGLLGKLRSRLNNNHGDQSSEGE